MGLTFHGKTLNNFVRESELKLNQGYIDFLYFFSEKGSLVSPTG